MRPEVGRGHGGLRRRICILSVFNGETQILVAEGEADSTQASNTHRVLGRGTRRHREEKLPPQCVGGPWP